MADQSVNALNSLGGISPAEFALPYVQSAFTNTVNNPYQNDAINSSILARDLFRGNQRPMGEAAAGNLFNLSAIAGGNADQALAIGNNPAYQQAGDVGSRLSPGFETSARSMLGDMFNPYVRNAVGQGNFAGSELVNAGSRLLNMNPHPEIDNSAWRILGTTFDPQMDLYNRTSSQLSDQVNAQLSRSGLGDSPYGASVAGKAASDFNLDWQDRQLGRMVQGGQAASGLFSDQVNRAVAGGAAASGIDTAGTNLMLNPSLQATNAAATDLSAAEGAGQSALSSLLTPANNRVAAQLQGTGAFGNLVGAANTGYGSGQNILNSLVSGQASTGALPYGAYNTVMGNDFGAAQNEINLGNANYLLPDTVVGDLMQYLGLGQKASSIASQVGANNFSQGAQTAQGLGSLLGGANSLFGGGSGGGLFSGLGGVSNVLSGAGAGGGAGGLASGVAGSGGGFFSDAASVAAPLAFSV